jgi:hypothetical protein
VPIARTALREQQNGRQSAPHAALRARTSIAPAPPRALRRASGRTSSFSRAAILRSPPPALESLKNSMALRVRACPIEAAAAAADGEEEEHGEKRQ